MQREEERHQRANPGAPPLHPKRKAPTDEEPEQPGNEQAHQQPKRKKIKKDPSATTPEEIKVRTRLPANPLTPCCLCAKDDQEGLLPVNDPPGSGNTARPFYKLEGGKEVPLWRAHEQCARAIPETWVDVVDGRKIVYGVDGIVKDRWALVSIPY